MKRTYTEDEFRREVGRRQAAVLRGAHSLDRFQRWLMTIQVDDAPLSNQRQSAFVGGLKLSLFGLRKKGGKK